MLILLLTLPFAYRQLPEAPNSAKCAVVFVVNVGTGNDIARFEQLTANFKMNMIYAYAGNALASKVHGQYM